MRGRGVCEQFVCFKLEREWLLEVTVVLLFCLLKEWVSKKGGVFSAWAWLKGNV